MASPTPLGIHQIAPSETYALVYDLNRVGITADAAIGFVKDRAEYLTDKAVADAGALSRRALNELPGRVVAEVDREVNRVIGDTREDAAEALTTANKAYEYNQALIAPATAVVNAVVTDPDSAAGALVESKVDKSSQPEINAASYGLVGDGATDNTAALQSAINAAYAAGRPLRILPGRYKVTGSVELPREITIIGSLGFALPFRTVGAPHVWIESTGDTLFTSSAGDQLCEAEITGLRITSRGGAGSALFRNVTLSGAYIHHNVIEWFGILFHAASGKRAMQSVTDISHNRLIGIQSAFNVGHCADSMIFGNHISGAAQLANATCFQIDMWTGMLVQGNYIDFFKNVLYRAAAPPTHVMLQNNRIDLFYRLVNGTSGALTGLVITGNQVMKCSASYLSYFPKADAEMQAGPWICYDLAGLNRSVISNNLYTLVDRVYKFRGAPNYGIQSRGNVYPTTMSAKELADFTPGRSAIAEESKGNHIDAMERVRVATLPNPSLTISPMYSYDGHEVLHNGRVLRNDNGVWRDALGNVVTT